MIPGAEAVRADEEEDEEVDGDFAPELQPATARAWERPTSPDTCHPAPPLPAADRLGERQQEPGRSSGAVSAWPR